MLFLKKKTAPKVCIIGSSHITALKRYWDTEPNEKLWTPTFFGANSISLKGLKPKESKLLPPSKGAKASFARTSGGSDNIDCTAYDEFYLHGMVSGSKLAHMIYDIDAASEREMSLSSAFVDEMIESFIRGSLLCNVAQKLRKLTDKPIYASGGPLPSTAYQRAREGFKTNPKRLDCYTAILEQTEKAFTRFFSDLNVQYISFPRAPISDGLFSHHDYMVGSQALDGGTAKDHPRHDLIHANDKYGQLLFKSYMKARG